LRGLVIAKRRDERPLRQQRGRKRGRRRHPHAGNRCPACRRRRHRRHRWSGVGESRRRRSRPRRGRLFCPGRRPARRAARRRCRRTRRIARGKLRQHAVRAAAMAAFIEATPAGLSRRNTGAQFCVMPLQASKLRRAGWRARGRAPRRRAIKLNRVAARWCSSCDEVGVCDGAEKTQWQPAARRAESCEDSWRSGAAGGRIRGSDGREPERGAGS